MNQRQRRQGGQRGRVGLRARGGFSLVESTVAVVLFGVGMILVTSAGSAVVRQLGSAREDLGLWGALQTVGDSLQQRGYGGVTNGSRSLGRYSFSWNVDNSTPNLDMVTLAGWSTGPFIVRDTVPIYLSNPNAP